MSGMGSSASSKKTELSDSAQNNQWNVVKVFGTNRIDISRNDLGLGVVSLFTDI